MTIAVAIALFLGALTLSPSLTNVATKTPPVAKPLPVPMPEPELLRLKLTLSDGSQVIGIPSVMTLPLKTSFAEMTVPCERIRSATFSKDHSEIVLLLSNGDRMTAAPRMTDFQLTTIFGKARIELCHVTAIAVIPGGSGGAYPRDGLWGYWPLDGDAKDASGNGHDGVIRGAQPTEGVRGQAYSFDGNSTIEVGNPDFANEQYTVAGWIRTDRPGQTHDYRVWSDKLDSTGGSFMIGIGDGRAVPSAGENGPLYKVLNGGIGVVNMLPAKVNLRDGQWHHCAVTYRKGSQKVFVGGTLIAENSYSGSLPTNSARIAIGGQNFGVHHPWVGDIDEVFIYQRALTDDEVESLYRYGQHGR